MTVAIDLGPSAIRALSFRHLNVEKVAKAPLEPGLIRDGMVLQPAAVGRALSGLLKTAGLVADGVVVSLVGLPYSYRVITLPRLKPSLRDEAVGRAAKREIPLPVEELCLSWQLVRETPGELEYFVIGVPRKAVDAVSATLREAGITRFSMDLRPLALARLVGSGQAIVADIGADGIEIVIVAGGLPVVLHSVVPRAGATAEDNVRRFLEELGKTVMFYNSTRPVHPIVPQVPLYLSGELVRGDERELVVASTEHPVEDVPERFKMPSGVATAEYAVCLGLALKTQKSSRTSGQAYFDVNVDVAVNRYGVRRAGISYRSLVLPVVAILSLVLAFTAYVRAQNARVELGILESQTAVFSQMLRQMRLEGEAARQVMDQARALNVEAQSLEEEQKSILGKRARFDSLLRRLWQTVPPGAYFTGITAAGDVVEVRGEAENGFDVVAYATVLGKEPEVVSARVIRLEPARTAAGGTPSSRVSFVITVTLKPPK